MFTKLCKPYAFRNFSKWTVLRNIEKSKPSEVAQPKPPTPSQDPTNLNIGGVPKMWERKMLVWFGKYKSLEDVPDRISYDTMGKLKSQIRIRIANWMMIICLLACVGYAYKGKMDAKRGDSLQKRMLAIDEEILRGKNK